MAARVRPVSLKPIGKEIQKAIKRLTAMRASATSAQKKKINLHIRNLRKHLGDVKQSCGKWSCLPGPATR
jgi:hypothetical protein